MGEKGGMLRWLLLGLGVFLLIQTFSGMFGKKSGSTAESPFTDLPREAPTAGTDVRLAADAPKPRKPESFCALDTDLFHAEVTSQGATLKRFHLSSKKYDDGDPDARSHDELSTTPDHEIWRQLFVHFRNPAAPASKDAPWNVAYDSIEWDLSKPDARTCELTWQDDEVSLKKTIALTDRPYQLAVSTTITNRAKGRRRHALTIDTPAFRYEDEVASHMMRASPFVTHVECIDTNGKATRKTAGDFEPGDLDDPPFAHTDRNDGEWYSVPGEPAVAAVSNTYFTQALIPVESPAPPECELQIWTLTGKNALYRARLAYPPKDLAPGESATYSVMTLIGPKERELLATAGPHGHLDNLIDLGFFTQIAKVLVAFLLAVHSVLPNWGLAIMILTITARMLLFPLSWPSIKNMVRMRQLKPEMDALTEKYKDDAQMKGLAQMELWKKHGVNPFKGCLPQLASMPVWFALYTTLQTAVELYNIPFLWFPDLSKPDPMYVLPS